MKRGSVFLCFCLLLLQANANTVDLKAGMVISSSITITQKTYALNGNNHLKEAVIVIEGNNIVVDFNKAILQGSNDRSRPDEFYGLGIMIKKGSKNITIKNAFVHGYKIAILADSVNNLTISNCDLSYNWRQHLQSNLDREDISDWMSYHHNENDEWLRYGAAIYLKNCTKAIISNNLVTGGQCALMMTRCERAEVTDNNFSFNSGIGIGMYRSSNNKIYHNRLDYNIRGFSFGKYWRGQDSAAILVFEQSGNNLFAFNTATHSGDGFFLWAGQSTMDTGTGGCNNNFIYGNDFSFAPTNGIEATFSQNLIMKNIVQDCDHGVWAGYSYNTDITDNVFANNRIGIAIEHGQDINIALNSFTNDQTGIKLWSRGKQPEDWVYAQKRNTKSRNYWIAANHFNHVPVAFDIMGTDTLVFSGNTKNHVENAFKLGSRVTEIDTAREEEDLDMDYQPDDRLKLIKATSLPVNHFPVGKHQMRITEWGPYDFRYPLIWLQNIDSAGDYHFDILGPGGSWKSKQTEGFHIISQGDDKFPSTIIAKPVPGIQERLIELDYTGPAFVNAFGKKEDSTGTQAFAYHAFNPNSKWEINWYRWDAAHDPAKDYQTFTEIFTQTPASTATTDQVDYIWWGAIGKGLPADSFATVAVTKMLLKENTYDIGITGDDYVKLFIDGKEVINAWDASYTLLDENTHHHVSVKLTAGEHVFKIVHAENTGLASLQFYIRPRTGL
jgi:parallel beta-helix repeat protein